MVFGLAVLVSVGVQAGQLALKDVFDGTTVHADKFVEMTSVQALTVKERTALFGELTDSQLLELGRYLAQVIAGVPSRESEPTLMHTYPKSSIMVMGTMIAGWLATLSCITGAQYYSQARTVEGWRGADLPEGVNKAFVDYCWEHEKQFFVPGLCAGIVALGASFCLNRLVKSTKTTIIERLERAQHALAAELERRAQVQQLEAGIAQ
jgi:hypothetical protein